MCHALNWDILTRKERLMDRRAVERYHAKLRHDYDYDRPGGVEAFRAHSREHREAAIRFAMARVAHVTHVAK